MTTLLLTRDAVALQHTWDLSSIYHTPTDWDRAYQSLEEALSELAQFQGRLGESPTTLLAWFQTYERLGDPLSKMLLYASCSFDTDTTNQDAAARLGRVRSLLARFQAAIAFVGPELLQIDLALLDDWYTTEPALAHYRHYLADVQRQRAHLRSAAVEDVLALASEPLVTPWTTYSTLSNGDLTFAPASDSNGQSHTVAQGNFEELLCSPDRTLRESTWNSFADGFLQLKNTFAALFVGNVQHNVFIARARKYPNALTASLDRSNLPVAVYNNVIDACNRHLHIWHRYWEIRRRALGLSQIEAHDIFAPLIAQEPHVPYEQAVDWICAGIEPLGPDYVAVARAGLTHERWVDIYPNQGKRGGAYANHAYGVHPYILTNYTPNLMGMSTLAHELGHAMHSYLTNQTQTFIYIEYTIFVGEIASNFNQALVRAHLLNQSDDPAFQIAIIEEGMRNFYRYLFLMPILSQFEEQIHRQVENHQTPTAATMGELLTELFRRGYGPAVKLDEPRVGITWAQFQHMYMNFYVFQYASGIAAANALADRVLAGEPDALENYLDFLKAGNSRYSLDALKRAGVDMLQPEAMDRGFAVLEKLVDRLDQLIT